MSDFWGLLIGVVFIGLFLVVPTLLVVAIVVSVSRGGRLRKLEMTSDRLERKVLDLTARLRQLEGVGPSPAASPAPVPAAPVPAAPTPEESAARLRERLRASAAPPVVEPARASAPPPLPPTPPSAPRTPPPQPPSGPTPPTPASVPIERVVGVLLTAGIGAVALALAGLLFFHYAVKAGWIGPEARVIIGTLVGIAAVAGSVFLERRTPAAANALAAGGVVVLYAAFWASHVMFHLVPMELAFVLMALVTAVTVLLADRRKSALTAVLGIAGGFATPMLLTSGSNRPFELFGYVLLLDAAFLWVAYRRRWAFLSVLALLGSLVLQGMWMGTRMEPTQLALALGITGVFAAVFAALGRLAQQEDRWQWGVAQAGGVLLPFSFALYLAARSDLGADLWPHAILLAFLCAAASVIGRSWRNPILPLAAAAGSIAVLGAFAVSHGSPAHGAWEMVAVAVGLAAIFHLFHELDGEDGAAKPERTFAIVPAAFAATGFGFLLVMVAVGRLGAEPWPFIAGFTVLSLALLRQARGEPSAALALLPAAGFPMALATLYVSHHARAGFPPLVMFLLLGTSAAAALQAIAFARRHPAAKRFTEHAAVLLPVLWLWFQPLLVEVSGGVTPSWHPPALALVGGLLAILAATRLKSGAWYAIASVALAIAHAFARSRGEPAPVLAILAAGAMLVMAWPFVVPRAFRGRTAWVTAALAGAVWFLPLRHHYELVFGDSAIGLLPIALAAAALAGAFGVRRALGIAGADDAARRDGLAIFGAVALGFVSLAVPLQLEKEWITVAWALEGAAVIWLWTKLDHPGLKWGGFALLAAVTVRLTLNVAVPGYHERGPVPVLNWILYTYWVPAAALLAARWLLARHEMARLRSWEEPLYLPLWGENRIPIGVVATSLATIGVGFVWINLAIADWFSPGERLLWSWEREPARDVAMSIAWGLYALVLLAIGMARTSVSLRWVSLAVLLLAIGKVFVYDLGELRDLYRVLSLLGLAFSLILVSFGYQRFVFRRSMEATS